MKIDYPEVVAGGAFFACGVYMMITRKYNVGDPDNELKVKYTVTGADAVILGIVFAGIGAYFVAHSLGLL
ncbi:MAG: hypothetical protein V4505_13380 [Pseudomonadota bacterium]